MRASRALLLPEMPPVLELMLSAEGCALAPRGGLAGATAVRPRSMASCSPVLSSRTFDAPLQHMRASFVVAMEGASSHSSGWREHAG
jgi:hypothetical protein